MRIPLLLFARDFLNEVAKLRFLPKTTKKKAHCSHQDALLPTRMQRQRLSKLRCTPFKCFIPFSSCKFTSSIGLLQLQGLLLFGVEFWPSSSEDRGLLWKRRLLFMTYNGWIMLAVGVGAFVGYLVFGNSTVTKSAACH